MDILDAIGNTSLVRLRRVVPPGCARDLREARVGEPDAAA